MIHNNPLLIYSYKFRNFDMAFNLSILSISLGKKKQHCDTKNALRLFLVQMDLHEESRVTLWLTRFILSGGIRY